MGPGEDYWHAFSDWFSQKSPEHRKLYAQANPEPESWRGFYGRQEAYIAGVTYTEPEG